MDPLPDIRGRLMLAFPGTTPSAEAERRLRSAPAAGLTLFRYHNVETPGQVRELVAAWQRAAAAFAVGSGGGDGPGGDGRGPLLVAADQEGGQLQGLGDGTTPFPGAMALGATFEPELAERVGRATGAELLAMGVNVAYAPVCDLASNPANLGLGIRSFGDDPAAVAAFVGATVRGLRAAGVAVAAKHFPGLGEADQDSHHALPTLAHDRARLDRMELVPFRAAIEAGADLVMSAHVSLPAVTGDASLVATLSRSVMHDLLRGELGFRGLSISDALDMAALPQGDGQVVDVVAAIRAGVDLLLCAPDPATTARLEATLIHATARRLFDEPELVASARRLAALRSRLAAASEPDLAVVGSAAHGALAREVAERSITLVRDTDGVLPLRLEPGARILAVMPRPRELTPADTSASVAPGLAAALRARWPTVDEIVTSHPPADDEIAGVVARARTADAVVIGSIAATADPAQARLVAAVLAAGRDAAAGARRIPVVTLALRTPWDLATYPSATAHLVSYGILAPTLDATAAALFGAIPFRGRLPVDVPGIAARGHGLAGVTP
ncbi:MAG: glycoside hydrolase family 3 N-terminal domain-containing protein [Chloroflexota bacterium]